MSLVQAGYRQDEPTGQLFGDAMTRYRKPKSQDQRQHAKRRAYERYGLELNQQEYGALCKAIQNGTARYMGRQSNRVTVWRIAYQGQSLIAVYDSLRHQIATFLPPDATDAKGVSLLEKKDAREAATAT